MTPLAAKVLELASAEVGVREHGRNSGFEVEGYNLEIGHDPKKADPWCATFACAMVSRAAKALGVPVPIHLTAGCFTLDEKAPSTMRTGKPVAGCIFITQGHRHAGLIEAVLPGGTFQTIEGNTNPGGSFEGDGVYRRTRKRSELLCFIDLNLA